MAFHPFKIYKVFDAFGTGAYGSGSSGHPVVRPQVLSSEISVGHETRILVKWDTAMHGTIDVRFGISITIDGAAPIIPSNVSFSGDYMSLAIVSPIMAGQVVTWSYDTSNATEKLESVAGVEAENGTHSVNNMLTAKITADSTAVSADSTQHTADEG